MNLSRISRFFNTDNDITNLFRIALIIWIIAAIYLVSIRYDAVYHLALTDTDDFMRYHQYTQWIKNGNWYLQPLSQFNPQDGQIMHWSRLADIPLALVTLFAHLFVDWHTAFTISNIAVPLIYLLIFLFLVSLISYRLFDIDTAKIAMLLSLFSPISSRFIPGSLDHHNLQFILLTIFILSLSLVNANKLNQKAFFPALAMSCSLWIGLENIYTFVTILFLITLMGTFRDRVYLDFCKKLCLNSVILISVFLILNRPITEFFDAHYDALSFPFLLCFISAYVFCHLINIIIIHYPSQKTISYILLGAVLYLPILLLYPELVSGGYSDYPALLKEIWLNNVTEATPIIKSISAEFKNIGYILALLPAMLSPIFFRSQPNSEKYWILYLAFCINFLLAFFWQIRMFSNAFVCSIPLQAYACLVLRRKCSLSVLRVIILFLSFPSVILLISFALFSPPEENKSEEKYDNKYNSNFISAVNLLNKHNIHKSNTLTTIDLGAAIIASTDNHIIAAPYHRNIRGNTDTINFFIAQHDDDAKKILDRNHIDYILIDENFFNVLKINNNRKGSIMDKLIQRKNIPDYLKFIDSNSRIHLYQYIGNNNK